MKSMSPFIRNLYDTISDGQKVFWIGCNPTVQCTAMDITSGSNCRVCEYHHRSFDSVWIFETPIFEVAVDWRLVLDESIRLLKEHGTLVVRSRDCEHGTLFELKSFLHRSHLIDVTLEMQYSSEDGTTISVYKVFRKFFKSYTDKSWTIGILSNGAKESNVRNLIAKLHSLNSNLEFIVCGPVFEYTEAFSVKFIDVDINDALPRIGEKKNKIIRAAANANIAIFHDRYTVDESFFEGFDQFGYDFDYLAVRQQYESGKSYPSYVGFQKKELRWQSPSFADDTRALFNTPFVNGGIIVVKRHLGMAFNINPLLLHNEAEDVEYGYCLSTLGVIPRYNVLSLATTVGTPEDYTKTFQKTDVTEAASDTQRSLAALALKFWIKLSPDQRAKIKKSRIYGKVKSMLFD